MFKDRIETIETVQRLRIPTTMIASAAGVSVPRVSDFLCHRRLNAGTSERIREAACKITFIWNSFQSVLPKIRILIDDPNELDRLFTACHAHELEKQLAELSEAPEQSFAQVLSTM